MKRLWLLVGIVALCVGCGGSGGESGSVDPGPTQSVTVGVRVADPTLSEEVAFVTGTYQVPITLQEHREALAATLDSLLKSRLSLMNQGTWAGSVQVVINASPTDPENNIIITDPVVVNGAIQTFSVNGQTLSFRQYLEKRFTTVPHATLYTNVVLVLGT